MKIYILRHISTSVNECLNLDKGSWPFNPFLPAWKARRTFTLCLSRTLALPWERCWTINSSKLLLVYTFGFFRFFPFVYVKKKKRVSETKDHRWIPEKKKTFNNLSNPLNINDERSISGYASTMMTHRAQAMKNYSSKSPPNRISPFLAW